MTKRLLKLSVLMVLFALSGSVSSAQIEPAFRLSVPAASIAPQSNFQVTLFLDSDLALNVVDVAIGYPADILEVAGFDTANSIINFWQEPPRAQNGSIMLKGGIYKAFAGRAGEVVKINFIAKNAGNANLIFQKSDVYVANGLGTRLETSSQPLAFAVATGGQAISGQIPDQSQPKLETAVVKNPTDSRTLLVFNSSDSASGVKATEARYVRWFSWSDWSEIKNPFAIPQGVWLVQIRTTDFQGNTAVQNVYAEGEMTVKIAYAAGFLAVLVLAAIYLKKRRAKVV